MDQDEVTCWALVENDEEISQSPIDFESNFSSSGSLPFIDQPQQSQLHRSMSESVSRHRFEIEWKAFMITPQDDD